MPPTTRDYRLRPASDDDYSFVESLYVETMRPLLTAFNAWDKTRNIALFKKTYYKRSEASIVVVDGIDAGWLQLHEGSDEVAIHQLHIKKAYRGQLIGTDIIKGIIAKANHQGLPVTLSVVKNNPALNLYLRLGFSIIGEDETKFHLHTQPAAATKNKPA